MPRCGRPATRPTSKAPNGRCRSRATTHYVEFSYDWPGFDEFRDGLPDRLCLQGNAPRLARVIADDAGPCPHPIRADLTGVYGWDALTRGRLYLGQKRAEALQMELQDQGQRGIVTIRQREDGSFTPVSIRFRPLTAAEQAERDAQQAEIFGDLPPEPEQPTENPPPSPQSAP
ncbi:MAG: hypothetical protein MUF47_12745 [Porphyrobacter sp.]|nr:hypothetical protein [Porphyrobacter sp.]